MNEIMKAGNWFREYPAEFKVIIAGNHDFGFEKDRSFAEVNLTHTILGHKDESIIYLQDSAVMLNGVKFYGSPWQPWFYDWAFNAWRGADIRKHWDKIPNDTQVLITHGPAFGICDKVYGYSPGMDESEANYGHAGCKDLLSQIEKIKPLIHISGHLHQGRGNSVINGVHYYKSTVVNEKYKVVHEPFVVEI